jgi:hypothetical protein
MVNLRCLKLRMHGASLAAILFAAGWCPPTEQSPSADPGADPQPSPPPEVATLAHQETGLAPLRVANPDRPNDPRFGLLNPIPDRGPLPPIIEMMYGPTPDELAFRAQVREYRQQIRKIRHEHFGKIKVQAIRQDGIEKLREFTDPAAFIPMIDELRRENDDVRMAVLDHLRSQGDQGQASLAHVAIYDKDAAIRGAALARLSKPASGPVLQVLDGALRSTVHETANNAGTVAGAIDALETIPLLIFSQVTNDEVEEEGDLAWILIGTQTAFVSDLEPVVGDSSGAFAPIVSVITSGVILRVVDAVAIIYRTEIHNSLVAMTTDDWGQSTADLGWDPKVWWKWYNTEYLPFKNEQARLAALSAEPQPPPNQSNIDG